MWKYDHFMRAKGQGHMRNGVLAPGSSKQGGLSICSGLASVARVTLRCSRRMHAQPKAPRWQGTAGRHRGQIESPAAILEQHGSRNPPSQRAVPSHGTAQATTARNATNAWRSNAPRPHAGDGHARGIVHHTKPSLSFCKFVVVRTRKRESHREPDSLPNLGFGMKPVRRTNEIKRVLSPSLPKVSRPKSCTGDHHASRQSLGRCSPTLSPREVVMPYGSRLPLCPSSICKSESHTIFAPWRPANSVSSLGPQLSFR